MMFSSQTSPDLRHRRPRRWLAAMAAMGAMAALAGCSGVPTHNPDTAGSASGVTVYGTVDAGIGRTKR